jgi:acetyltransferase-like isoleucine patch superfamily enzyme
MFIYEKSLGHWSQWMYWPALFVIAFDRRLRSACSFITPATGKITEHTLVPGQLIFVYGRSCLGKAEFSKFFVVSQGCTVGNHHGEYPVLGRGVAMGANALIIGSCRITDRVSVGSNATVFCRDILSDMTVYKNESGETVIKRCPIYTLRSF